MNRRHSLALVAGAATILASLPLWSVFKNTTWLFYAIICVAVVIGTAMLVRALRGPAWAQVLAMTGALLVYLTWLYPSGGEFAAIIPSPETFRHFNTLLGQAGQQIRLQAVPVNDHDGVLLLTTAGIGLVAVLVDLTAVGIRRPALAGLPMLAIYSVPVAVLQDGVNLLTFALACAGYLWLLVSDSVDRVRRFGRRFSGEGRDVDLWEPSPLSAAGRRLGLVGIVVAILIPLAVPGMTTGFLDRFGTGSGGPGRAGEGDGGGVATVDLRALLYDNLIRTEKFTMAKVRTDDPDPYYLRLGVADQVDNNGFNPSPPTGGDPVNRELAPYSPSNRAGVTARRYTAEVEVPGLDLAFAPVYQQLVSMSGLDGSWLFDNGTHQVYSRRSNIKAKRYRFEYVRTSYTPNALRTASPIAGEDAGARQLTRIPENSYVRDLVAQLTRGKLTEYDKVRAIYDYFSVGFTYSFNSLPGDSGSPIQDFLTNKQGFCVQYASAMAWLVREAHYPARVAFGFTRGSGSRAGGELELTNFDLHAWTEVYFPDFGWVPFDTTPAASITGSSRPAWAPDNALPSPDDPSSSAGPDSSVSPGASAGIDPRDPNLPEDTGLIPILGPRGPSPWWFISAAVLAVVLLIALLLPSARRRAIRRGRRARSGTVIELGPAPPSRLADLVTDPAAFAAARQDAHGAWEELVDTMVDFGVEVDPSETPRATAERLAGMSQLAPPGRAEAIVLARAEERARYARAPIRPDRLNDAVRVVRTSFAERATRTERFMATVFPRSVLNRWRLGWIGLMSRGSRITGQVRETLLTISPRRLLTRTR